MASFEQMISKAAFDLFHDDSDPALSPVLNGVPVAVIIDRSVEVVDEEGNVRQLAALVQALKGSLPAWVANDLLTAPSGNVRLLQTIADDGYVVQIEARPVA